MNAVMKKIYYTHLIFLLLQISAFAQNYWELISIVPVYAVNRLAIDLNNYIFVGAPFFGFLQSTDDGESWEYLPIYASYPSDIAINSNNIIFAATEHGAFRSTDSGEHWTVLTSLTNYYIYSWAFSSNNNMFAGTSQSKVLLSTDSGDSWTEISNGLTNQAVNCLAINSINHIFAGTWGGGIFRSTDNGGNWIQLDNGLIGSTIKEIAINSNDYIFVVTSEGGVFRSIDNGDSWIEINDGLSGGIVNCLVINNDDNIFVGAIAILYSKDNGDNWIEINSGLDTTGQTVVLEFNSGGYIYAVRGTWIYRSINSTTSIENDFILSAFSLQQNYPNPFNPSTMISYQIPQTEFVTLKVYDILGREVATLVNEEKTAGSYEIQFESSSSIKNPASGIYFYKISWRELYRNKEDDSPQIKMSAVMKKIFYLSLLLFTSNAFPQWEIQNPLPSKHMLNDVQFISENIGWTVGGRGRILKTTDGGINWTILRSPTLYDLYAVHFIDSNNGFTVGYHGLKLKTTDGGNTWIEIPVLPGQRITLYDVFFTGLSNGIAVGQWLAIFRTTDGGYNWTQQTPFNTGDHLLAVYFINPDSGIAVGTNATSFQTTDSGITWVQRFPNIGDGSMTDIYFNDSNNGKVVSSYVLCIIQVTVELIGNLSLFTFTIV